MALHSPPLCLWVEPDPEHAVSLLPARRILIIGNGGAGKSTLAAALSTDTDLPVIHLDRLYWRAGWEQTPRSEWVETLRQLIAPDAWILDGNYRGTLAERLERADALVLLDPLTPVCLWRIVRRRFGVRQTSPRAATSALTSSSYDTSLATGALISRTPLPRAPPQRVPANEYCTCAVGLIPCRSPSLSATMPCVPSASEMIKVQTKGDRS